MRSVVEAMLRRDQEKTLKAEYITRDDEDVLFVRRVGDYEKAPKDALDALLLQVKREDVIAFYGMGLDDPHIVPKGKLRFDMCVSLNRQCVPSGEMAKKVLPGGPYAVFTYEGPYSKLEEYLADIYRYWYLTSGKELADAQPIFEYVDLVEENDPPVTRIYLPLNS